MKKRGDGEVSGLNAGSEAKSNAAVPDMQVGASIADLLVGSGQNANLINVGQKPASMETADDNLFAAIMAGDVDYVQRRAMSSGKLSEGAAFLVTKAKGKSEEHSFVNSLLLHVAGVTADKAEAEERRRFFQEQYEISYFNMREEWLRDEREIKRGMIDQFGGYVLAGRYYDRMGGFYDDTGYTAKDGSFRTLAGDVYNAASGLLTLADGGAPIVLDEPIRGLGKELKTLAKAFEMDDTELAQIQKFWESDEWPTDPEAKRFVGSLLRNGTRMQAAIEALAEENPAMADRAKQVFSEMRQVYASTHGGEIPSRFWGHNHGGVETPECLGKKLAAIISADPKLMQMANEQGSEAVLAEVAKEHPDLAAKTALKRENVQEAIGYLNKHVAQHLNEMSAADMMNARVDRAEKKFDQLISERSDLRSAAMARVLKHMFVENMKELDVPEAESTSWNGPKKRNWKEIAHEDHSALDAPEFSGVPKKVAHPEVSAFIQQTMAQVAKLGQDDTGFTVSHDKADANVTVTSLDTSSSVSIHKPGDIRRMFSPTMKFGK